MSMKNQIDITFVTCNLLPTGDEDDVLALRILQQRGFNCQYAIWNDASVQWDQAGLVLIRSTWDYHLHVRDFISWAKQRGAQLINRFDLVMWNSNKSYLLELEAKGVTIIPTFVVTSLDQDSVKMAKDRGWDEIIVKPGVGLSTHGVKRFNSYADSLAINEHIGALLKESNVLVQRFMPAVAEYGERALTFIDGQYSHTIKKAPFQKLSTTGHAGETAVIATQEEILYGRKVLNTLSEVPVYARVDLVPDQSGRLTLMELELIEPSLFLSFDACSPMRFADALQRQIELKRISVPVTAPTMLPI